MTELINLPQAVQAGGPAIWDILKKRRTVRAYRLGALELPVLSQLLWAAAGISGKSASSRTAPSAGGKHPATVLVAVNRVTGLEPGVYRYEPRGHGLELLASGAFGDDLQRACLGQDMLSTAAAVFAWSVAPDQATQKYGERGHRYVLLDLGHACQNLYLAATALGLGCCAIGAYRDEQVNSVFSVGGISARVLYMATVGIAGS